MAFHDTMLSTFVMVKILCEESLKKKGLLGFYLTGSYLGFQNGSRHGERGLRGIFVT